MRKHRIAWPLALAGVLLAGSEASGQVKPVALPEVTSAYSVKAWNGKLYVSDARTRDVLVYALEGGRFLGRLGKAGQGPGEFDSAPRLVPTVSGLAAKPFSRLLFFSPEGVFLRESKGFGIDLMASGYPVFPVQGGYIGFPFVRGEDGRLTDCIGRLYDDAWKPVRDFGERFPSPTPPPPPPPGAKRAGPRQTAFLIRDAAAAQMADGRLYFGDSRRGLALAVFDVRGERIGTIGAALPRIEVPRAEKSRLLAEWRDEMKAAAAEYDPVVPDAYPAFLAFRVDGTEIHAVTAAVRDGRREIVTFDLKGRILRRAFLFPLEPTWGYPPDADGRFDILDGILYAVDYNEAEERYEMKAVPLR